MDIRSTSPDEAEASIRYGNILKRPTKTKPWQVAIPEPQALAAVPNWLVIRNASDPQIDGNLSVDKQIQEAVFYYKKYGYFTSLNSAIAVWAVVRGASL